jgi:hypothetical protein
VLGAVRLGWRERRLARILDSTVEDEDLSKALGADDDLAVVLGTLLGFGDSTPGTEITG